jgi:hypothetical protein
MSKLQELILYIARRSEDVRHFGANKLNKLLFYTEFLAYSKTGRSITGATYERLEHGPAPRGLAATLEELKPACADLTAILVNSRTLVNSGVRGAERDEGVAGGGIETLSDAESETYGPQRREHPARSRPSGRTVGSEEVSATTILGGSMSILRGSHYRQDDATSCAPLTFFKHDTSVFF